ncbi:hypothetical protein DL98DRAFT_529886 [Cadophora sp. DSE1049]|nr:hypothetical protein DL98DRAFT_529886 [Cadophora sp. DSE1049]
MPVSVGRALEGPNEKARMTCTDKKMRKRGCWMMRVETDTGSPKTFVWRQDLVGSRVELLQSLLCSTARQEKKSDLSRLRTVPGSLSLCCVRFASGVAFGVGKTARIPAWLDAKILRVLGVANHLDILAYNHQELANVERDEEKGGCVIGTFRDGATEVISMSDLEAKDSNREVSHQSRSGQRMLAVIQNDDTVMKN